MTDTSDRYVKTGVFLAPFHALDENPLLALERDMDLLVHLDRLKRSADEQGFRFDRHAARNELQAATFGKRRPATARLLLSPTGAMAIEVRSRD